MDVRKDRHVYLALREYRRRPYITTYGNASEPFGGLSERHPPWHSVDLRYLGAVQRSPEIADHILAMFGMW